MLHELRQSCIAYPAYCQYLDHWQFILTLLPFLLLNLCIFSYSSSMCYIPESVDVLSEYIYAFISVLSLLLSASDLFCFLFIVFPIDFCFLCSHSHSCSSPYLSSISPTHLAAKVLKCHELSLVSIVQVKYL